MTFEIVAFEEKEIRTIETDGEVWFPLIDLALAWGFDRTSLPKHLDRNKDFFEGCSRTMDILSHDGTGTESQECVNEVGLYLLLARMSKGKVKNPAVKEAITRFRKRVPELIQRYRKREIVPVQLPNIKTELQEAGEYAEICKCDPKILQAAVFEDHGKIHMAEAIRGPAVIHGETGWYNPTGLVALCNDPTLTPERLNWYLRNNPKDPDRRPFQERDVNGIWRLTELGKQYGREYQYRAVGGHIEPRIEWRDSILYASGLLTRTPEQNTTALSVPG